MDVRGQLHTQAALLPAKEHWTPVYWIVDCVGLRAGLNVFEKKKSYLVPAGNQTPDHADL